MLHATCYMLHKHATFYMLHDTHVTRTCYDLHATLGGGKKFKCVINLMVNKRFSLKQAVAEVVPSSHLVLIQFRYSKVKICTCLLIIA